MVNLFNENNRQIKDSNKIEKSERDIKELIKRNKEIQEDCALIDSKINDGKEFAVEIEKRLDLLLEPMIPNLREKY